MSLSGYCVKVPRYVATYVHSQNLLFQGERNNVMDHLGLMENPIFDINCSVLYGRSVLPQNFKGGRRIPAFVGAYIVCPTITHAPLHFF